MSKWIKIEQGDGEVLINLDLISEIGMDIENFTIEGEKHINYEIYFGGYENKKYGEFYDTQADAIERYDFLKQLLTS